MRTALYGLEEPPPDRPAVSPSIKVTVIGTIPPALFLYRAWEKFRLTPGGYMVVCISGGTAFPPLPYGWMKRLSGSQPAISPKETPSAECRLTSAVDTNRGCLFMAGVTLYCPDVSSTVPFSHAAYANSALKHRQAVLSDRLPIVLIGISIMLPAVNNIRLNLSGRPAYAVPNCLTLQTASRAPLFNMGVRHLKILNVCVRNFNRQL